MKRLAKGIAAVAMVLSTPAAAQGPVGDWLGTIEVSGTKLRIVVHVSQAAEGELTGTLDSPDQLATGLPISDISRDPDTLAFSVPVARARYSGKWDAAAKVWKGQWQQGQASLPLDLAAGSPPAPLPADWTLPSDSELRKLIADRIAPRAGEGIVVGVLDGQQRRVVAGGPVTPDTLFEIGSISKVFTSLILADMAAKGEVSLDDPAEKYLPAGAHMPQRGRKITLRDLAMHRSGLPRLPDNLDMADPDDPYADYTEAQMLAFLGHYQLPRDVGVKWEYSNFGVGLLGYLLGRAAHTDYATLLRQRITVPLGMKDTPIALSPQQQARLAKPHDPYGRATKPWKLAVLAGAGGIRSTVPDMLTFAAAVLDSKSPLAPAMKLAISEMGDMGSPRIQQALGWEIVHPEPGRNIVTHDGGTGGFRSSLTLEPNRHRAVVVLANSAAEPSTTDLAFHALIGASVAATPPLPPAPPPPSVHTQITLSAAELERVVGRYDFGNGIVFVVSRDGDRLTAQREGAATGPMLPIYPEAPLKFFWKAVDAQVTFVADKSGKVTGAVFSQNGQSLTGTRVD